MTEDTENTEEQHSRREVMKGGAALGTAALISKFSTGVSQAQQTGTEPRLQLGDDWELDDYDDGSGNTNVRLRHIPSGAELRYSVADNAWIPSGQIGLPGDRPDAYLDTADANSLSTGFADIAELGQIEINTSSDLSSSRSLNTEYQNTNDHTLLVTVQCEHNPSSGTDVNYNARLGVSPSSGIGSIDEIDEVISYGPDGGRLRQKQTALVPPTYYYELRSFGSESLTGWFERPMAP